MPKRLDENFSEIVLRKKGKGYEKCQVRQKANLDKKHFSKIVNDVHYQPKKQPFLALSRRRRFNLIVKEFADNDMYDVFEISKALVAISSRCLAVRWRNGKNKQRSPAGRPFIFSSSEGRERQRRIYRQSF
ncbi:MAG: hypothetical protein IKJ26_02205 [Clostridia bacterium]|nr:hypothetical protein [Clostridia bacterium]